MRLFRLFNSILMAIFIVIPIIGVAQGEYPYQNSKLPIEKRVDDLVKRMTLKEKIAELNLQPYYEKTDTMIRNAIKRGEIGALLKANGVKTNRSLQEYALKYSRLGIPLMFHEDVIHGYRTLTPIPLGESCSWDVDLVKESARLAAREASAAGIQLTYAPMVDVSDDPRWGRIMETAGEDGFLGSALAAARVEGFQGDDLTSKHTVAACVKHFAGYGALVAGRDYQNMDFSYRDLQERYLPPFKAAIDAGVSSVMCSYTSYDGEPVTMNYFLNTTILRDQLKFKGLLMSDWTTFDHAVTEGAALNGKEAAQRGMDSGMDMDMTSKQYLKNLEQLLAEKKISMSQIDNATAHALTLKFQTGLFDDPYRYFDEEFEKRTLLSDESKEIACRMTVSSMVLLKNNNQTLPILNAKSISLVGPFATEKQSALGRWAMTGRANETVNVVEGVSNIFTSSNILALGCGIDAVTTEYIDSAQALVKKSDIAIVCLGEHRSKSGEAISTATLELPAKQLELLKAVKKEGKPVVVVIYSGRPLLLDKVLENCDALIYAWYPGTMGGEALALLLSGKENPSAKLTQTFPRHSGQIPIAYNQRRTFKSIYHDDIPKGPQFSFGFGLSYTDFAYSSLEVDKKSFNCDEKITISVKVKNSGKYEGREVVQLYVRDEVATIIPREKELKGFASVVLKPGEEKTVKFTLDSDDLMLFNNKMKLVNEPGEYTIMVGTNSESYLSEVVELN